MPVVISVLEACRLLHNNLYGVAMHRVPQIKVKVNKKGSYNTVTFTVQ